MEILMWFEIFLGLILFAECTNSTLVSSFVSSTKVNETKLNETEEIGVWASWKIYFGKCNHVCRQTVLLVRVCQQTGKKQCRGLKKKRFFRTCTLGRCQRYHHKPRRASEGMWSKLMWMALIAVAALTTVLPAVSVFMYKRRRRRRLRHREDKERLTGRKNILEIDDAFTSDNVVFDSK